MKRFLILLIVVVMAVPAVFAEVTVGGWGRIILSVSGSDVEDSEPMMDMGPNWGADGGRVRFVIKGSAEKIGFQFDVDGNVSTNFGFNGDEGMAVAEFLCIWVKPIEMLKITAGKFQIDTLRGKFGQKSAAGDALWIGGGDFEDKIFARNRFSHGVAAEISAVEGLTVNLGIQYETADADGNVGLVEGTLATAQAAAGYNIEGIGLIRAQYIGYNETGTIGSEDFQAAFALTMVEGLLVDLGVTIDLADPAEDPLLAFGASYKITDDISATLCADVQFSDMLPLFVALTGTYSLGDVSLNAELAFNMVKTELSADVDQTVTNIEIYPFARMGLGNGYCSAGVKISMNSTAVTDIDTESVMVWSIPIVMEYWF